MERADITGLRPASDTEHEVKLAQPILREPRRTPCTRRGQRDGLRASDAEKKKALPVSIKRDPFEMATGEGQGTLFGMGGALAGPVTTYVYDWNVLPIGQQLWLKELDSYKEFPPLQSPESYNLTQIEEEVRQSRTDSAAGD